MSGEGGHGASGSVAETQGSGSATLVCGASGHDAACRRLAQTEAVSATRIRVKPRDGSVEPCADTDNLYDTGVYEDLGLSEAGIVVSDSIENIRTEVEADANKPFVVCVDSVPHPRETAGRERLFRFLHALTRRVQDVDGDCHVHLSVSRAAPLATVLAPLFDDVVTADAPLASGP